MAHAAVIAPGLHRHIVRCGLSVLLFLSALAVAENLKVGVTLTFYWDYNFLISVVMAHLDLMKHFNSTIRARFGPPVLELENPHPNLSSVEVITRECASSSVICMAATQDLIWNHNVNAIAGDFITDACESTGALAAPNAVPHIAMCMGDTIGDRSRYPYTFRNTAPVGEIYSFMWKYMQFFQFRAAILLYTSDGFGTALNNIKDYAQQLGQGGAILSVPLLGSVPFEEATLSTLAETIQASPIRLLILGCRSEASNYVHSFLLDYNLTKPHYQILTTAASRNSQVFSTKFIGWHSVSGHTSDENGAMSKWFSMRSKLTQEDITSVLDKYGMSSWSPVPYVPSKLPSDEDFSSPLSELVEGFSIMAFNAVNTAFVAMNQLLNKGYDNDAIRGSLLREEILGLDVPGVGKNTSFNSDMDAWGMMRLSQYSNVTLQFDTSSASTILLPVSETILHGDEDGNFPEYVPAIMWPDDTQSTQPPKEFNQCHPGMYVADDGSCAECPDGSVSSAFDVAECVRCAEGSFSDESRTFCSNCTAGTIASERGLSTCQACPAGQYINVEGGDACILCPTGTFASTSGSTACTECPSPLSTAQVGSKSSTSCICPAGTYSDSDGVCQDCPEGMTCAAGSQLANLPRSASEAADADPEEAPYPEVQTGYYATYEDPLSIYECFDSGWCPGGLPEACATNSEGIGCGNCKEGYFRDVEGGCSECSSVMRTRGLLVALPTLAIPVVFWLTRNPSDAATWYRAKNQAGPLSYIGLFFLQTMAMYSSFSVSLPSSTASLASAFSISLDVRKVLRPECAEFHEYSANFTAGLIAPIYLAFIVALTWAISRVASYWWNEARMCWCAALSFYGACYSTFFVSIANLTLKLFACYPHPNGKSSIQSAPYMLCYEDEWSALVGAGTTGFVFYCVFAVSLMILAIWQAPRFYSSAKFRIATKFLFVRFRIGCTSWSIVLLLKGLAVSLTPVMFSDGVSQFMWIVFVLASYSPATAAVMPWRSTSVAFADIVIHMALSYAFALGGFFIATTSEEQNGVSAWLVVCVIVAGMTLLGVVMRTVYLKYMQDFHEEKLMLKREEKAAALASEMKRMSQNEAMLTYLLKVLPDWEIKNLETMQEIFGREVGPGSCRSVSVSIGENPDMIKVLSAPPRSMSMSMSMSQNSTCLDACRLESGSGSDGRDGEKGSDDRLGQTVEMDFCHFQVDFDMDKEEGPRVANWSKGQFLDV